MSLRYPDVALADELDHAVVTDWGLPEPLASEAAAYYEDRRRTLSQGDRRERDPELVNQFEAAGYPYLGGGATRCTFALDDRTVLKVAKAHPVVDGRRANLREAAVWRQAAPRAREVLCPTLAVAPDGGALVQRRATPVDVSGARYARARQRFDARGFTVYDWTDNYGRYPAADTDGSPPGAPIRSLDYADVGAAWFDQPAFDAWRASLGE